MNPAEIMNRLEERYSTCLSYKDIGYAISWREDLEQPEQPELTFKTLFSRPNSLRFEWQEEDCSNLICSDGLRTFQNFDFEDEGTLCKNILEALVGATGISMGTSFEVPALLMRGLIDVSERNLLTLHDLRVVGSSVILGAIECYHMAGTLQEPFDMNFWVSMADFSLRRIRELNVIGESDVADLDEDVELLAPTVGEFMVIRNLTEITYEHVAFDEDIDDRLFLASQEPSTQC